MKIGPPASTVVYFFRSALGDYEVIAGTNHLDAPLVTRRLAVFLNYTDEKVDLALAKVDKKIFFGPLISPICLASALNLPGNVSVHPICL